MKNKTILIAVSIFCLALAVRLIHLYECSDNPSFTTPIVDSGNYDTIARDFADGNGMSDYFFWQPFFYPFFLSAVYFFTDSSILAAKIIQALIGAVTCLLTFHLGKKIFNLQTAIIAGIITALYGPLIFFETELLASGWAAFWSVVLILLFIYTASKKTFRSCFLLGICGALSIITRPTFIPFVIAGCICFVFAFYKNSKSYKLLVQRLLMIIAGFAITAIPLAVTCKAVTEKFTILPSSGGINFYVGNNPDYKQTLTARPGWGWNEIVAMPYRNSITGMWDEQRFFYDKVTDYITEKPVGFLKGLAYKTTQFFSPREIPRNINIYLMDNWSKTLSLLAWKIGKFGFPFGVLLPFAILGLICQWRKLPAPLLLFIFLYPFSIILVFVTARYRIPVIPVMSVLAAAGITAFVNFIKNKRRTATLSLLFLSTAIVTVATLAGPFPEELPNYEAELYANVGASQILQEKLEDAIANLQKSLEIMPESSMAHANLGTVFLKTGKSQLALEHYEQAAIIKPDSPDIINNYAKVLALTQRFDQAIRFHKKAIELYPAYPEYHFDLGNAFLTKGDLESAVKSYRKAIELNPTHQKAHLHLGRTWYNLGNLDLAQESYEKAFELNFEDIDARHDLSRAYNDRAKSLDGQEKYSEAIKFLEMAVDVYPLTTENHIMLAQLLAKTGKTDTAVEVLNTAIDYMIRIDNMKAKNRLEDQLEQIKPKENNDPNFPLPSLEQINELLKNSGPNN